MLFLHLFLQSNHRICTGKQFQILLLTSILQLHDNRKKIPCTDRVQGISHPYTALYFWIYSFRLSINRMR
ncbi:hypothetical protein HMPREF9720_2089 [Alistipes sp. HGB5]|nr:hypothetical protein HMPREF9720_2089 [Alistipes sp. HGB5]